MSASIQGKMAKGALWMVLFKLVERSLGLVSTLILVRLLSPTDFGIVSMAMSFVIMAELLAAFSFDIALIQNQSATEDYYHSAWTGNVLLGLLITFVMLIAAYPISRFYHQSHLLGVVCLLAFGPFISGLENIGVVAFRKNLEFRKEFAFQITRKVLAFCVTIPLAFYFHSYWALVAGTVAGKLTGTLMSYWLHPFRPHFSLMKIKGLLHFSRWLLLINLVNFFKERSSDFVIGRLNGPAALGLYNVSYEVSNLPTTELSFPINRALMPGFAKLTERSEVSMAFTNAIGLLALVALPAAAGLFAVAPFLVPVMLGAKWLAAVPIMQILSFNGALLLFHSPICSLLVARGYPADITKTNATFVVLLFGLFTALVPHFGALGAAYSALGASLISTPIYLYFLQRRVKIGGTEFLRAVFRPLLAAALMVLGVRLILPHYDPAFSSGQTVKWLVIGVATGVLIYPMASLVLWLLTGRPMGAERLVLNRVQPLLLNWRGKVFGQMNREI